MLPSLFFPMIAVWTMGMMTDSIPQDDPRFVPVLAVIDRAISEGKCPGAVVEVARADRRWRAAVGNAATEPATRPMTPDVVFDMASLTKPMATAASVMLLVDRGQIGLDDPVARFLPEFANHGKEAVTIRQCLTHTAGFVADNPMSDYADGREKAIERIMTCGLKHPPGEAFVYSDVGFIVLGLVVERVSGRPLDRFAREEIYQPLGMTDTGFTPDPAIAGRCAPTEPRNGEYQLGVVHDPRAFALGGVAGHAGLFSTLADVGRFARMILNGGELDGVRIYKSDTVKLWTTDQSVGDGKVKRALGFDVSSSYSSPRGELLGPGSFGHTGWTGTSLWIDPERRFYVILLTNRVHPDGKGDVKQLRSDVATAAVKAMDQ